MSLEKWAERISYLEEGISKLNKYLNDAYADLAREQKELNKENRINVLIQIRTCIFQILQGTPSIATEFSERLGTFNRMVTHCLEHYKGNFEIELRALAIPEQIPHKIYYVDLTKIKQVLDDLNCHYDKLFFLTQDLTIQQKLTFLFAQFIKNTKIYYSLFEENANYTRFIKPVEDDINTAIQSRELWLTALKEAQEELKKKILEIEAERAAMELPPTFTLAQQLNAIPNLNETLLYLANWSAAHIPMTLAYDFNRAKDLNKRERKQLITTLVAYHNAHRPTFERLPDGTNRNHTPGSFYNAKHQSFGK